LLACSSFLSLRSCFCGRWRWAWSGVGASMAGDGECALIGRAEELSKRGTHVWVSFYPRLQPSTIYFFRQWSSTMIWLVILVVTNLLSVLNASGRRPGDARTMLGQGALYGPQILYTTIREQLNFVKFVCMQQLEI
jgi:hypothetical protein